MGNIVLKEATKGWNVLTAQVMNITKKIAFFVLNVLFSGTIKYPWFGDQFCFLTPPCLFTANRAHN